MSDKNEAAYQAVRDLGVLGNDAYQNALIWKAVQAALDAKSEPVTIERDGLRRAIQGVLWNALNYPAKVVPLMLGQDVGPLTARVADAVIAHLDARPVAGTATQWQSESGMVTFDKALADRWVSEGSRLFSRTVSEWTEAPNGN